MAQLLFPLALFLLMWVFLIRPQQQRVRRQRELIASLEVGDEVVTAGGVVGTVVELDGDEVRLEVSPGIVLRFMRMAVNSRISEEPERAEEDEEVEEPRALEEGEEP